jgi:glycosyltransferase involved in cell wall biosynthesis
MKPLVSIGIPVKNGFANRYLGNDFIYSENDIDLAKALDAIINQSYTNLEIIISNNGSTDETYSFLEKISKEDKRIKIFNQQPQILPLENFQFVLNNSTGKYFKWNAADDLISKDYIEHNVNFLENNLNYANSSSKFWFENDKNKIYSHNLDKDLYNRLKDFFKIRFVSHNIFFGLARREILIKTVDRSKDYLAIDWMTDLDLLLRGRFKTIEKGYIVIGAKGFSKSNNFLKRKRYNNKIIYKILPFYEMTKDLLKKIIFLRELSIFQKISIFFSCVKINLSFVKKHKMNKLIERKNYKN